MKNYPFIILALLCTLLLMFVRTSGQVYNYIPLTYNEIETNPSYLTAKSADKRIKLTHLQGISPSNYFSMSNACMSKYFESAFTGLGLSVSNTNMDGNTRYDHLAVGAGYRNVLFNKLYIRLGASYKVIQARAPIGRFDYFQFLPEHYPRHKIWYNNVNLSASLASGGDKFYVTFAMLNADLGNNHLYTAGVFPSYYVCHVGNLVSLWQDRQSNEISYSGFKKISPLNRESTFAHFINLKMRTPLTRRSYYGYGARLGFVDNSFYQAIPYIAYYRQKLVLHLSYAFQLDKENFHSTQISTVQLSLVYQPQYYQP